MRKQRLLCLSMLPLLIGAGNVWGGPAVATLQEVQIGDLGFLSPQPGQCEGERSGKLTLIADEECYDEVGDFITVAVRMSDIVLPDPRLVVGGQFFLTYNCDVLEFIEMTPGDEPFVVQDGETHDPDLCENGLNTIDYFVGIRFGDVGTNEPTNMAYITFRAIDEFCGDDPEVNLVFWRDFEPPTRLSDDDGCPIPPVNNEPGELVLVTIRSPSTKRDRSFKSTAITSRLSRSNVMRKSSSSVRPSRTTATRTRNAGSSRTSARRAVVRRNLP